MVMSEVAERRSVRPYVFTMAPRPQRITSPVTSAASRIAVPVADSQLNVNTAASGAAVVTTGGTRNTALSSPTTVIFGAESPLSTAFTCGSPHANTSRLRMIHGAYARALGGGALVRPAG